MASYKTIKPPQKYMNISQMHDIFGERGLVAYSCKIVDSGLEGGVVIAVQNENTTDTAELKAYQRQLRKKHPDKDPIYYLKIEKDEPNDRLLLTYDHGAGERKIMPKLEVKKSKAQKAIEQVPDEFLAQALKFE
jgi:hypothetical protein